MPQIDLLPQRNYPQFLGRSQLYLSQLPFPSLGVEHKYLCSLSKQLNARVIVFHIVADIEDSSRIVTIELCLFPPIQCEKGPLKTGTNLRLADHAAATRHKRLFGNEVLLNERQFVFKIGQVFLNFVVTTVALSYTHVDVCLILINRHLINAESPNTMSYLIIYSNLPIQQYTNFYRFKLMEKAIRNLCQFIYDLATSQQTINACKFSPAEVKAIMEMIDIKRKGFLDLDDVYELVGKVTQTELFDIFKFLDTTRNGEIGTQQLQEAIGDAKLQSKNTTKEYLFPKFYKIVDTVKDKPKNIAELKKKYSFDSQILKEVYHYICKLVQSKYLSSGELITVLKSQSMKYGIRWINQSQTVVKELLPGQNIPENKFFQVFAKNPSSVQKDQQALLNDTPISSFYPPPVKSTGQTQKIEQKSPAKSQSRITSTPNSSSKYQEAIEEKTASILYKKTNNFVQSNHIDTPSFQNIAIIDSPKRQSTDFEKMEGNINNILDNISQRREKLRQDSLERKKLIDGVMQRKKVSCGVNSTVEDWQNKEQFARPSNTGSNLKKTAKTYLHNNFQAASQQSSMIAGYSPVYQQKRLLREQHLNMAKDNAVGKASTAQTTSSYLESKKNASQPKCIRQTHNFSDCRYLGNDRNAHECGEISDLMKKYYRDNQGQSLKPEDDFKLKQMNKSKSGFIKTAQYDKYFDMQVSDGYGDSYEGVNRTLGHGGYSSSSFKMNTSVKQNVLRRAEQQAAKKIEQIQRKARMKVLQKKNAMTRGQREEPQWGRLIKRGMHY